MRVLNKTVIFDLFLPNLAQALLFNEDNVRGIHASLPTGKHPLYAVTGPLSPVRRFFMSTIQYCIDYHVNLI